MATAKKRPSGSWRVLVYTGKDAAGKRVYESFTAPTKKEAEYLALKSGLERKNKAVDGLSVGEAIDAYISSKDAVLSPRTVKEYRSMRNRIFPELMSLCERELNNNVIQSAVNLYSRSRSPKSARNAYGLLSTVLRAYFPELRIAVTLPQKIKSEIQIPDDEQVRQLMDASQDTELYTAILLAGLLSLRRSEITPLEWSDFNVKARTLRINKAMVQNENGLWVVKTTKTTSSTRTLSLPKQIYDHLLSLPQTDKRIFTHMITPEYITHTFIRLRNKLGMTLRFHDLRHYYASLLLALGVPDKYAMQKMGHSTSNMLKTVYQHTTQSKQKEVDAAINSRIDDMFK